MKKDGAAVVKISEIASMMKKTPRERRLPNGAVIKQIIWESSDLPGVWAKATPLSGTARHVIIDGAAPAWLVTSITHAVHPASVSLADPKVKGGKVPIYTLRPSGSGHFLVYKAQYFEEFCVVKFVIPGGILDPADLPLIAPPRIQSGKGVVLSGRGPNWLTVSLAMGYAHCVPWVGLYQPGMGATVTITHSKDYELGQIVAITEGKTSRWLKEE